MPPHSLCLRFAVALVLLALPGGCLTQRVLALGRGIEWLDDEMAPPQSRIVPHTLVLCASGELEVHADAFPPPGVQWRGRPTAPVRLVSHTIFFARVLPGVRFFDVTYSEEVGGPECRPIAERAQLAIPPEHWRIDTGAHCQNAQPDRVVRSIALEPGQTSVELAPELLDVVPIRSLEVSALSDLRPALTAREPAPATYALLPLALAGDGAGYTLFGAALVAGYGPMLALGLTALPIAPFLELHRPTSPPAPGPENLEGMNLSAQSYVGSGRFASASLRCANLVASDLRRARFGAADLAHTRLLDAQLGGADLSNAKNLTQSQLDSACGDAETRVPPGLNPPPPCPAP